MNLHLVGGFLGSGKTTAIIQAARLLMEQGLRVGVITNDQGKYLVDTAFVRFSDIPAVEVTGGCFCCNYDDLDDRLGELIATARPDVIFAESVGSCADVVATVVKPLLALQPNGVAPSSFSVFSDARLLRRRLLDQEMPFSDDVVYIFDQQMEEAGLLVVNKMDLLPDSGQEVEALLRARFPGKPALLQTSLSPEGVAVWVARIQAGNDRLPAQSLEMDYARYAAGEAHLAWLDTEMALTFAEGSGQQVVRSLILQTVAALALRKAGIGHLKFYVEGQSASAKISVPTIAEPGWQARVPILPGTTARLIVNARVEMPAEDLRDLLRTVVAQSGAVEFTILGEDAFHPKAPRPTHRM
jgi:Ni2+-binding GTPase involved in maturation of urease and hydrogenase